MFKKKEAVYYLLRELVCFFLILFLIWPGSAQGQYSGTGTGTGAVSGATTSTIKSLLSNRGQVLFGNEPNSLMVIDYPENIKKVEEYLEMVDVMPQQVHIEARVVEVKLKNETSLGVDWTLFAASGGLNFGNFDMYSETTSQGITTNNVIDHNDFSKVLYPAIDGSTSNVNPFTLSLAQNNINMVMRTLASKYDIDIVSAPSITTVNNSEAVIKMANVYPWAQPEIGSIEGVTSPSIGWTVNFEEAGIILTVTPTISADGKIIMDLIPEISEKSTDYSITTTSGATSVTYTVPVIETRQAQTRVVVGSGETLIIGGLIKNKEEEKELKIPLLGDIPYLGYLFKTKKTTMDKRELVIFVSPTIINTPEMEYSAKLEKKVREDVENKESKLYEIPLKEAALKAVEEKRALAEKEAQAEKEATLAAQAEQDLAKKKVEALYSKGVNLYFNRQFKQSEAMFKEILRYDPNHKEALSYLEEKLPEKISEEKSAKPRVEKIKAPEQEVQQEPTVSKKNKEAESQEADKKKMKAAQEAAAKKALQAQAKELYSAAFSLYQKKQYNEAYAKFQELEALSPGYSRSGYYLARIPELIKNQNRLKQLKEAKEKEAVIQAKAEEVYKAGISLYNALNYKEAYLKFEEAQKLIPGYKETEYYLSKIPEILERQQRADQIRDQKERDRAIKEMLNSCE